ncbi:MAG TPA: peptidyl-prolyl cis-trans isomerase, partial [Paracoccaceae bacterium]|nr:peptidyl-prolyl cis-trans isomerase [Paracoccaceae bacterium]
MMQASRSKTSKFLFYGAAALMIISMAGFGINGALNGTNTNTVADVGDQKITSDMYFRAVRTDMNALSRQLQQSISIDEMVQSGRAASVLNQLLRGAAIDGEAERLSLSISDQVLRDFLLQNPAFIGSDGKFNPAAYTFAIEQSNMKPAEYEAILRSDAAREMVMRAVLSGAAMPDIATTTILDYIGEERNISYVRVTAPTLVDPIPEPTEAQVQAFYEANPAVFTTPLTRDITYISVSPSEIAESLDIPEADIIALYDSRVDTYVTPARRFMDRIAFSTRAQADEAKAALDSNEKTFEDIAADRGLSLPEIDMGEVAANGLGREARDEIFGTDEIGVFGPFQTDLGPVLYRVNAVLDEQVTTLDEVRDELRSEIAMEKAVDQALEQLSEIDDLLLGGATLEEAAADLGLTIETIALADGDTSGIAAYAEFRELAATSDVGRASDITALPDGGLVALRVNSITEASLQPLADTRELAVDGAKAELTAAAVLKRAELLAEAYAGQENLNGLADFNMLPLETASAIVRGSAVADLPPAVIETVFALEAGDTRVIATNGDALIVRLDEIVPLDYNDSGNKAVLAQLAERQNSQLNLDLAA